MKKEDKLNDYGGFAEKFKPKKTTDDCYTPPHVYNAVLEWVKVNADIEGCEIVRPFYPGGDYENYAYPNGCVVIDNPPFSILAPILRFFMRNNIRFFLFAPHLTLFKPMDGLTYIISNSSIVYENGAVVRTSFVSNLSDFSEYGIIGSTGLRDSIERAQAKKKKKTVKTLPTYSYPPHVVTSSSIANLVNADIDLRIKRKEMAFVRSLESQKRIGKGIFGAGFLVGDRVAERLKAERLKAATVFELSERELEIIKKLNG